MSDVVIALTTMQVLGFGLGGLALGLGLLLHLLIIPRLKRRAVAADQPLRTSAESLLNPAAVLPLPGTPASQPLPPIGDWLPLPGPNLPLPPRVALQRDAVLKLVRGGGQ